MSRFQRYLRMSEPKEGGLLVGRTETQYERERDQQETSGQLHDFTGQFLLLLLPLFLLFLLLVLLLLLHLA